MKRIILITLFILNFCHLFARDYYVGGSNANDNNAGTSTAPYATIQKAASVAVAGDVVNIRSGTYRETIVPSNSGTGGAPIVFQPDNGATVIISGANQVTSPWTLHNGNIYKTSVTLPVNGHQSNLTSTTTILSNQIFKDGDMMFEARWPKIAKKDDLLDLTKMRHITNMTSFNVNSLSDNSLPSGIAGGKLIITGWFITQAKLIKSQAGTTINFDVIPYQDVRFRQRYYVTGKLTLLTDEKEWHYESGVLYFRQPGGGSPTGVEYKARNWGFDLRNKSNITIAGLRFFGCEPMTGNATSNSIVIDNIRASYMNHCVMQDINVFPGYGNPKQTGIKLLGSNCVIKNSELQYAASHGIWLGENGRAENNLIHDISYEGNWGAGVGIWGQSGQQVITGNTIYRAGRSCIDLGFNYLPKGIVYNLNVTMSYNDLSQFLMLNVDGGGIYGWGFRDMTGSSIHHNWIHDMGVVPDPRQSKGINLDGIQTATYFDQASGPFTLHHNVYWNNGMNLSNDAADHYTQPNFEHRNAGSSLVYNNTFGSTKAPHSYVTYITNPLDVQRNNIYRKDVILNWGASAGNIAYSLKEGIDPLFLGTGQGGLVYRLKATSPAINAGTIIAGITDGSVGTPDIGAYEYGGTEWVPGYKAVATQPSSNIPPVVSITTPANNAVFLQGAVINVSATATDVDGSITKVEFFNGATKLGEDLTSPYAFAWSNAPTGTSVLTAKATDNQIMVTTSTAVNITVNANTAPTVSVTGPSNNAQFTTGVPITITATAADTNGSVTKVEFFNGATKLGEDLTSPYSFVWNNAPSGTFVLTAKATDNQNSVTTSALVSITVSANPAPTVAITSPANNSQFINGVSITITAAATDANGSVTKVEFFNGATKLGEDQTTPYSFVWNNPALGTHTLTVKATDNQNSVTTSSPVTVTVSTNPAPNVAITSPANNSQSLPGDAITITATASDGNGTVTKVEFFNGLIKLGEDLTPPYSFTWQNVPEGNYTLSAKATDNQNAVGASNTININVTERTNVLTANAGEDVFLTLPTNSVKLKAATGLADYPELQFNWAQTQGPPTNFNPFLQEITLTNLTAGTYVFTVTITDGDGFTSQDEVTVIVSGDSLPLSQGIIPRSFSPDGDGSEDFWIWPSNELYENSILTVYSRSGQKVYEAVSYNNTWDGTMNGHPLQKGDYYYVLLLRDLTKIQASLQIIR